MEVASFSEIEGVSNWQTCPANPGSGTRKKRSQNQKDFHQILSPEKGANDP